MNLLAKSLNFSVILFAIQIPAASAANVSDEHIRQIVEGLLKEKDQKIQQLEARIQQLEHSPQAVAVSPLQANTNIVSTVKVSEKAPVATCKVAETAAEPAISSKLGAITDEIEELREAAKEKGLDISGFFDLNAKTDNSTDQTFSLGSVELDLSFDYFEHLAASSAIVLCGNSSGIDATHFSYAPAAVSCGNSGPGGIGAGSAGIGVAFVDYHLMDHSIPPRGRIFNHQGLHFQAGRFDLPFSTDYQNFANKDRVTVTAPITTSRMQFGGYNGDGVRSYGSWNMFNYSVFWTDAMYAKDGTSVGGRLGLSLGKNMYRTHKNTDDGIEFGMSHLSDLDKNRNVRNSVYGADLSLGYSFLKLQNEVMWRNAHDNFIADDINYGKPNELGYHTTLLADLENFIGYPVTTFARYGRWQPHNRKTEDYDGALVAINNVSALTFGLNYKFNEYFKLKFEYTDSLGTQTQERYFDKNLGIAQLVVAF
ncbi:MAG: hypothetical protein Q8Q45_14005 [Methylococcaceae bacterium]|nr:hypothetical protein [Methylococcaceae bacterium]